MSADWSPAVARALLERNRAAFPPPPCPVWCALPSGHPYDDCTDVSGMMSRDHLSDLDALVAVAQYEVNTEGVLEITGPHVWVREEQLVDLSLEDAKALAQALTAAVEMLEVIDAGVGRD